MGKPSKNQRTALDREPEKALLGKPILYVGSCGTVKECPTCKSEVIRAIMWEDKNIMYCSRGCIPKKVEA